MHIAAKLAGIGLAATLAGCSTLSSLNPFSRSEPANPPAPLLEFKQGMAIRTAWSVPVGRAGSYAFAPVLADGSVFAAAADGTVLRIDPADGKPLWRIDAGLPLTAGVGSDGGTIAVVAEKGRLLAFDPQGKLRWKAQLSSEVLSAPAVGKGLVIVRSVDNRIAAFDAESGERRWLVQRSVPALTLRSAPGIAIAGPAAYVALPGGRLLALALSNGGPIWEVAVGDPRGTTELERIADASGMPVIAGRDVCAGAYQGRVACFDAVTGAPRWAREFSSEVGVAVDERFLFSVDDRDGVNAFTRASGTGVWRNDKLANRRLSTPVSFERSVAVGDFEGYVHFLGREDGAFLARAATDGSPIVAASPLVAGNNVIFQTRGGKLVALTSE